VRRRFKLPLYKPELQDKFHEANDTVLGFCVGFEFFGKKNYRFFRGVSRGLTGEPHYKGSVCRTLKGKRLFGPLFID
jgi:hypothetical protein